MREESSLERRSESEKKEETFAYNTSRDTCRRKERVRERRKVWIFIDTHRVREKLKNP